MELNKAQPYDMREYFSTIADRFGAAWTRFWFAPSDPFVLGLLRLFTGLVAIYWYLTFYLDVERFFGPEGLLPLETVRVWRGGAGFSLLDYLDSTTALWTGYWIGLAILVLFAVGWMSRITSVLALVVVTTFIHRGPMLATGLDEILAMIMLYLCIGPSGASFSVDAWRRSRREETSATVPALTRGWSTAATISTRLLQVHLTAVYFMMALAKLKVDLWWTGTAVWWVNSRIQDPTVSLTRLGRHLYPLNLWTLSILFFELGFAIFIWNRWARPLLLGLSLVIWPLTAIASGKFAFAAMMLVANFAFFEPAQLRRLVGRRPEGVSTRAPLTGAAR